MVTNPDLRACVLAAAEAIEASRDELTRLDAVAGDADHGVTMTLAARAVRRRLNDAPDLVGPAIVTAIAGEFASVGGSIGPLYAAALFDVAATMERLGL